MTCTKCDQRIKPGEAYYSAANGRTHSRCMPLAEPTGSPSGIEALVCADIAKRQSVGLRKYGMTLADNPAQRLERLQHAYEESLDLPIYLRWEIERTKQEMENEKVETIKMQMMLTRLTECVRELYAATGVLPSLEPKATEQATASGCTNSPNADLKPSP